jgi:NAD(P)-dependent dehydrogenase (short-subunit alcohol dehydrogenase family)
MTGTMRRFEQKTILVTGAAMGIGAATAGRLAAEGATAIIADCNEQVAQEKVAEIQGSGGDAWFQHVDLASPSSIEEMGREVAERVPCLHGLVNNAGILRTASIAETGDSDWEPQMTVNLRAPALCAKALLPLLREGPGHIVNLSSEGAFIAHESRWVYTATKAGILALTRNMAREFVHYGMRANTVAPGWTVTEMHFLASDDPAAKKAELEGLERGETVIPRLGRPEEIAAVIAFLLSDDASYMTASIVHVDGGRVTA